MGIIDSLLGPVLRTGGVSRIAGNLLLKYLGYGSAGKMTKLTIDTSKKSIAVELELAGEPAPLTVDIAGYAFEPLPDGTGRITIAAITISKPWMQAIANNALLNKPLPVPADFAKWLKMIL